MGIESNGMVLAASPDGGKPTVVSFDEPAGPRHASAMIARRLRTARRSSALAALRDRARRRAGQRRETKPRRRRYFASIRNNPSLLLAFLAEMPKGGDLHNHLSGAIYAESYLRWAAEDKLCVADGDAGDRRRRRATRAPGGRRPRRAARTATLFNQAIDAMSMRHWDPSLNGHDHFFATFGKFGPSSSRTGDMLAEVAARAAAEHVSYLELMVDDRRRHRRGRAAWRPAGIRTSPKLRDKLLAAGFRDAVVARGADAGSTRPRRASASCCNAERRRPSAGCLVTDPLHLPGRPRQPPAGGVRADAGRLRDRQARSARRQPQPGAAGRRSRSAVRDFSLHMSMLDYLHTQYPRVKITLHAGELTDGLVPPEALRFHIRESIRTGTRRASATAPASCTKTIRWRCCARWRRRRCSSRSR